MALALMAKAFKLSYSTLTNNNHRISLNPRNRQIAQPGMNMGQDRQMQMVEGNGGNQFRQYVGQNVGNTAGYNDVIGNQPEWSRHVTIVHQTKDLHTADYTKMYDFLKQIAQPGMNMGQDRQMQRVGGNGGNQFRQYAWQNAGNPAGYNDGIGNQVIQNAVQNPRVQNVGNQNVLICVQGNGNQNQIGNGTAPLQTQLLITQKEEAGIQLQAEEYDLMAAAANLDEIEEVNANCILMANLQQASTLGTQTDSAPVYDTNGSAERFDRNMVVFVWPVRTREEREEENDFGKSYNVCV
nr:hypothetical protein [Tanacetum cinerariifolium]